MMWLLVEECECVTKQASKTGIIRVCVIFGERYKNVPPLKLYGAAGLPAKLPLLRLSSRCGTWRITKIPNSRRWGKNPTVPQENTTSPAHSFHTKIEPLVCACACVCVPVCECVPNGCAAQKSKRASTQRLLISIWVEGVHSWLPWEDRNYTLPEGRRQSERKREIGGVGGSERETERRRETMSQRETVNDEKKTKKLREREREDLESKKFARTRDGTR